MLEARYLRTFQTVLLFLIVAFLCPFAYSKVIYVDDDAGRPKDDSNWENAYTFLQDALADAKLAEKPVEIRIAQGVYKPDQGAKQIPGEQQATFQLINGVTLKGGYAGLGELDPDERDVVRYQTVLSGDLSNNDGKANDLLELMLEFSIENSFNVVVGTGTDDSAVLDGFVITRGNDNRLEFNKDSLWIELGYGAGMYNNSGSPTIIDCTFLSNYANAGGSANVQWGQ